MCFEIRSVTKLTDKPRDVPQVSRPNDEIAKHTGCLMKRWLMRLMRGGVASKKALPVFKPTVDEEFGHLKHHKLFFDAKQLLYSIIDLMGFIGLFLLLFFWIRLTIRLLFFFGFAVGLFFFWWRLVFADADRFRA